MKIAAREMNLLFATLAVVLLALTYLALEPKLQEWADFGAQREDLEARRATAQQLLDNREAVESKLAEFRQGLPVFAAGKKAEKLSKRADKLASKAAKRRAEMEKATAKARKAQLTQGKAA